MAANKRRENELKTPKLTPVKETIGTIDRLVNFKISATAVEQRSGLKPFSFQPVVQKSNGCRLETYSSYIEI